MDDIRMTPQTLVGRATFPRELLDTTPPRPRWRWPRWARMVVWSSAFWPILLAASAATFSYRLGAHMWGDIVSGAVTLSSLFFTIAEIRSARRDAAFYRGFEL